MSRVLSPSPSPESESVRVPNSDAVLIAEQGMSAIYERLKLIGLGFYGLASGTTCMTKLKNF